MSTGLRARVTGSVQQVGFRQATVQEAHRLGILGWVRNGPGGDVLVHAEGEPDAIAAFTQYLHRGPAGAQVTGVELTPAKREGHEQFAIRGVSAGVFVVQEHYASTHHFDFRLELGGVMKSWAVPKGPSMDPAAKRLAVQVDDHDLAHNDDTSDTVSLWDRGTYEQGGRVPWPEAIERGHAVFVLHGEKLQGGFALQRTRGRAGQEQWLLVKRRDEFARSGD